MIDCRIAASASAMHSSGFRQELALIRSGLTSSQADGLTRQQERGSGLQVSPGRPGTGLGVAEHNIKPETRGPETQCDGDGGLQNASGLF